MSNTLLSSLSLHPCWFCNSNSVMVSTLPSRMSYAVECKNCLACGPHKIDPFRAALAWNRAAFPEPANPPVPSSQP